VKTKRVWKFGVRTGLITLLGGRDVWWAVPSRSQRHG
jgi:hypothetical protein